MTLCHFVIYLTLYIPFFFGFHLENYMEIEMKIEVKLLLSEIAILLFDFNLLVCTVFTSICES